MPSIHVGPLRAWCIGLGAHVGMLAFFASRYFGLKANGRIYGMLFGAFLMGSGTGAFLNSMSFDLLGSYRPAPIRSRRRPSRKQRSHQRCRSRSSRPSPDRECREPDRDVSRAQLVCCGSCVTGIVMSTAMATVREMEVGPPGSAIRRRSQATASCCGQNPWW
jgi:hypothetical protein